MSEAPRIGVFICHCGANIAGVVNVKEVLEYARSLPNVVEARDYVFMCSAPGQSLVKESIEKHNLNRVVVAACSPTMHEHTFRTVLREAGLNPYVLEMANIRELCSWPHHEEKERATEKAKILVRMAVAKASLLEPLEEIKFKVNRSVMVVGGGVAGLTAASSLAEKGLRVFLVERTPTLGGWAARLGRLAHTDMRGSDVAWELTQRVAKNPLVSIHTNTELLSVDGSVGNFKVRLAKKPRYVNERCILCGECGKVCPVEVPNEYEFGLSKRKAIYLPFKNAYPRLYVIDMKSCIRCGRCVEVCPVSAINLDEGYEEVNVDVGAVIVATGFDPYEPPVGELGYGLSNRVVTLFQLDRMLDPEGPTGGEVVVDGERPKNIVFIMCVGSLDTTPNAYSHCSRMCCSAAIRSALNLRSSLRDATIYILHRDIRVYGRAEEQLYLKAGEQLVRFARVGRTPDVAVRQDGRLEVTFFEETIQDVVTIQADMVVLVVGMKPPEDVDRVRTLLKIGCGPEGFLKEAHLKLRPVESTTDGVFLAGAATGPKNISESVASGGAAASRAAALLSKEEVGVEPLVAVVNETICSGCSICVSMCPYGAIVTRDTGGSRVSNIDPTLCKGCGACVAACPSRAIEQYGYKNVQLEAQLRAALTG